MKSILTTSVASLIATCIITPPKPAFGDESTPTPDGTPFAGGEGRSANEDTPTTQLGVNDRVAGEEPPDFSFLEGGNPPPPAKAEAPSAAPKPAAESTPPPAPAKPATPAEPEKGGKPPKLDIKDPNDDLPIPAVKPAAEAKETKEQPIPPTPDEQKKIDDAKKAEEDKRKADEAKAEEERKKAEAAPKPEETKEFEPPTDEEIDKLQLKPGASKQADTDFKKLKNEVVKPMAAELRKLKEQAKNGGNQLTPEIEAKLKQAEEDRQWREAFELERDPKLQAEYKTKVEKAEGDLYDLLQNNPRLRMRPEAIEQLKQMGLDTEQGRAAHQKILEAVKKLNDDILFDEVKDAFKARDGVLKERDKKLAELRTQQGGLQQIREEREKEERMGWAKTCDTHLIGALSSTPDLFALKEAPADATPEAKALVEAHNKNLKEVIVPAIHEGIRAVWMRDPEKTMQYIVANLRLPAVEKERDGLKAKLDEALARVAELEGDGARLKRVTSVSQPGGAPPPPTPKEEAARKAEESAAKGGNAEDAVEEFLREKGLKQ